MDTALDTLASYSFFFSSRSYAIQHHTPNLWMIATLLPFFSRSFRQGDEFRLLYFHVIRIPVIQHDTREVWIVVTCLFFLLSFSLTRYW